MAWIHTLYYHHLSLLCQRQGLKRDLLWNQRKNKRLWRVCWRVLSGLLTHTHTHTKRHFYLSHTRTDGSFCTMHSLASSNLNHHILMSPEQHLHLKMEGWAFFGPITLVVHVNTHSLWPELSYTSVAIVTNKRGLRFNTQMVNSTTFREMLFKCLSIITNIIYT